MLSWVVTIQEVTGRKAEMKMQGSLHRYFLPSLQEIQDSPPN